MLTEVGPADERADDIERVFSEFLERLARGERLSMSQLCSQYPGYAAQLRERYDSWRSEARKELSRVLPDDSVQLTACSEDDPAWAPLLDRLKSRGSAIDRYRFDGELARGAWGILHKVYDPDARRPLALKLALDRGPSATRLLEEAQITAQLDHPSIVPIHEIGVDDRGRPYFTMKLVAGEDLRQVFDAVKRSERLWCRTRALLVLSKVCEAMIYAHGKGVVHRDLKPENIRVGSCGEVYVLDWGMARILCEPETTLPPTKRKATEREGLVFTDRHIGFGTPGAALMTSDGFFIGTPAYMAPEQVDAEYSAVGPVSDVYAVGAMLYELLTGEVPYCDHGRRLSPGRILEAVRSGPPTPIKELAPHVPDTLVTICERAMARQPDMRTASMRALGNEILAYLEKGVGFAESRGVLGACSQSSARKRRFLGTLALIVIVAAAITAVILGIES